MITGISLHELIYDLSYGIRLPNPAFCPGPIANLLKKCFCESPDKRPNFKEIRLYLLNASKHLDARLEPKAEKIGSDSQWLDTLEITNSKYNTMKAQYSIVLNENKVVSRIKQGNKNYTSYPYYTSKNPSLLNEKSFPSNTYVSEKAEVCLNLM